MKHNIVVHAEYISASCMGSITCVTYSDDTKYSHSSIMSATCWSGMIFKVFIILAVGTAHAVSHFQETEMTFNVTCDPYNKKSRGECQNESLDAVAIEVKDQINAIVQINIKIPQLHLNSTINFNNLNSLTISGEPGSSTIICTAGGNTSAGIVLNNITGIVTLRNLNLTFCGSKINTEVDSGPHHHIIKTYNSALTIAHSRSVELNELVIAKSKGLGLTILDHQGGRVNVISTIFKENKVPQEYTDTAEQVFGGGVYILVSGGQYLPMTFVFENCEFQGNVVHAKYRRLVYTDVLGEEQNNYGHGGGAYILLKSGFVNVHISFLHCKFIANKAFIGGGLSINVHREDNHEDNNITVEIKDTQFQHNGCGKHTDNSYYTGFGGGLHLMYNSLLEGSGISNSHYLVKNVSFTENCAELGGGVFYYSYRGRSNSNSMLFDACTFKRNTAHLGSAIAMTPSHLLKMSSGYMVIPIFQNCRFLNNCVFYKHFESHEVQRAAGVG